MSHHFDSFERAKDYIKKSEEYFEMAFLEYEQNNWTREQKVEFIKILLKILSQEKRINQIWRI